ncbi:MAG TPA: hypothetical protein VLD18_07420, partial [Verrucomicrobiae bacterium]|nr:hypothetical protein [Verrucomicrobiae bacterium]
FFSWHCYTADPAELVSRAKAIRALLDAHGFTRTESHLNEWNFLPGNSWEPLARSSPAPARQRYYEAMAGAPGAAFIASALIELQDAPLDVANLFHGELGAFGLFNEFGVPQKNYHALRAFRGLLDTPHRVEASGGVPGQLAIAAGLKADRTEGRVLISNFNHPESELRLDLGKLPWTGDTLVELRAVDGERDFEVSRVEVIPASRPVFAVNLASPAVSLVTLRPATTAANERLIITSPANRLVFQRNREGRASIPIAGRTTLPDAVIETRLLPVSLPGVSLPGQAGDWERVTTVRTDGTFRGRLEAKAGWYTLELRARPARGAAAVAQVERLGVGEVF